MCLCVCVANVARDQRDGNPLCIASRRLLKDLIDEITSRVDALCGIDEVTRKRHMFLLAFLAESVVLQTHAFVPLPAPRRAVVSSVATAPAAGSQAAALSSTP